MQTLRWVGILLLVVSVGCKTPPQSVHEVRWRLSWDAARLQRHGTGWRWQTDLGYQIDLDEGSLTTWRLGLEPCPPELAWSLLPRAWAHHLEPPDPTSVMPHLREDLLRLETVDLPARAVPPNRYCRGLWLASPPPPALAGGQPRVSVHLRGRWHKDGREGPLTVSTWVPDARFEAVPGLREARGATTIEVTRSLADTLDGVDLATANTEALAWHALHRLTGQARWRATAGDDSRQRSKTGP